MMGTVTASSDHAASLPVDFEAFYEGQYQPLLRLAYVLTGSRGVAEDLVQETMLRAYRAWPTVSAYDRPGGWAYRVLCNMATSRGRRAQAEARALMRLRGRRVEEPAVAPETAELWAAVRRLPRRQAQATALAYLEDRSIRDIATIMDCAEGTVKALLHNARQQLARELGIDDEGQEGDR
jgi:RNA polymerase sigma-70 factor, ECF subfamily